MQLLEVHSDIFPVIILQLLAAPLVQLLECSIVQVLHLRLLYLVQLLNVCHRHCQALLEGQGLIGLASFWLGLNFYRLFSRRSHRGLPFGGFPLHRGRLNINLRRRLKSWSTVDARLLNLVPLLLNVLWSPLRSVLWEVQQSLLREG